MILSIPILIKSLDKGFLDSLDVEIVFILSSCGGWFYTGKFESDKLIASLAIVIFNPGTLDSGDHIRKRAFYHKQTLP